MTTAMPELSINVTPDQSSTSLDGPVQPAPDLPGGVVVQLPDQGDLQAPFLLSDRHFHADSLPYHPPCAPGLLCFQNPIFSTGPKTLGA
jgi:hypothetical protein